MTTHRYTVEITTESGPQISRIFDTLRAARTWAKWCASKWPARIMRGGQGGEPIASYVVPAVPLSVGCQWMRRKLGCPGESVFVVSGPGFDPFEGVFTSYSKAAKYVDQQATAAAMAPTEWSIEPITLDVGCFDEAGQPS